MKRTLERRLSAVAGFESPRVPLEQYPTPAAVAAHVLHRATLHDDLAGRTVVDLGTGTGMLALGAALCEPARVLALDVDPGALAVARENERTVGAPVAVDWLLADATRAPLCPPEPVTVVMNPPFGAQRGAEHADRAFLATAAAIARVSYSIHNEGSADFVRAFAADSGGTVTHAFRATIELDRQFPFHRAERRELLAEVFRIEWER